MNKEWQLWHLITWIMRDWRLKFIFFLSIIVIPWNRLVSMQISYFKTSIFAKHLVTNQNIKPQFCSLFYYELPLSCEPPSHFPANAELNDSFKGRKQSCGRLPIEIQSREQSWYFCVRKYNIEISLQVKLRWPHPSVLYLCPASHQKCNSISTTTTWNSKI